MKYLAVFAIMFSFIFQSPDEKSHAHCIERYVKKEQEKLSKIVFLLIIINIVSLTNEVLLSIF